MDYHAEAFSFNTRTREGSGVLEKIDGVIDIEVPVRLLSTHPGYLLTASHH